jgi:hypothetical protein
MRQPPFPVGNFLNFKKGAVIKEQKKPRPDSLPTKEPKLSVSVIWVSHFDSNHVIGGCVAVSGVHNRANSVASGCDSNAFASVVSFDFTAGGNRASNGKKGTAARKRHVNAVTVSSVKTETLDNSNHHVIDACDRRNAVDF